MAKSKKGDSQMIIGMTNPSRDDEYQTRDDTDTIMKHQALREDKKRYAKASDRIKNAARSCTRGSSR